MAPKPTETVASFMARLEHPRTMDLVGRWIQATLD